MRNSRIKWIISPYFYYSCAILMLIFPFKWITSWFFAAAVHELCHYAALRLCKVNVCSVKIGILGAVITTEQITSSAFEMFCALAGPAGGLLLLFFARQLPRVAICALFQSLYNLLPIYPLDGGRAICNLLVLLFNEDQGLRIYCLIKTLIFLVLLTLSIMGIFHGTGLLPLLFTIALLFKSRKENPLANGLK